MSNRIWILGAPDPEMNQIQEILTQAGEDFVFALTGDRRVHPGTAYKADSLGSDTSKYKLIICVECSAEKLDAGTSEVILVDHHHPGDPGYGFHPEQFWMGSSLGQTCGLLGIGVVVGNGNTTQFGLLEDNPKLVGIPGWHESQTGKFGFTRAQVHYSSGDLQEAPAWAEKLDAETLLLVAAGDHCPGAAYQGKCPGVDPEELMEWRAQTRANFQNKTVDEILIYVDQARKEIRKLRAKSGSTGWVDFGNKTIPELPEAALREGVATLATVSDRDGNRKLVLGGADPDQTKLVEKFISLAKAGKVSGQKVNPETTYGDPIRGFAGVYLQ